MAAADEETVKSVAQIAQETLADPKATPEMRRLAAWVVDYDERSEAVVASQERVAARKDAQLQRIRQRAAAAGVLGERLAAGAPGASGPTGPALVEAKPS